MPDAPIEVPYPFPPDRHPVPGPAPAPPAVPLVDRPDPDPLRALHERRTVMVSGVLDAPRITSLCAELMALDGTSARPVELLVSSPGGPLDAVSAVLDVMAVMRAPVDATCLGEAGGTAAVVLACATGRRRAGPHSRVSLRCRHVEDVSGSSDDVARRVAELDAVRRRVREALVAATALSDDEAAAELEQGAVHDADAARRLGIVDEVREGRRP